MKTLFCLLAACALVGCSGSNDDLFGASDPERDATADGNGGLDGAAIDATGGGSAGDADLDATASADTAGGHEEDATGDGPRDASDAGAASDAAPVIDAAPVTDASPATDAAHSTDAAPAVDASAIDAGSADCGAAPALHPSSFGSGPYCPFSTASLPFATCAFGEHCCEPPAGSGTLSVCASSCPGLADGGTDWVCQDPVSCPSGQRCCAITTGIDDARCAYPTLNAFAGTVCATSCTAGQRIVCQSNSECPSGTTCQPTKSRGASFGVCR